MGRPSTRERLTRDEVALLRSMLDGRPQTELARRIGMESTLLSHVLARRRRAPDGLFLRAVTALSARRG